MKYECATPDWHADQTGVPRSTEDWYALDRAKPGRPLRFTLAEARRIKAAYWTGRQTITALARENSATPVTISRLVHGLTYWYT